MNIGIIGAMPSELADIRETLGKAEIEKKSGFEYHTNEYCGKKIISACSGVGKVNSSLCAQNMITEYKLDCLINAGIAGGMDRKIKICDIVISDDVVYHDLLERLLENYPPYNSHFKSDKHLIEAAEKACRNFNIDSFTGRIVSGEIFVSDNAVKQQIKDNLDPYAVDMESASIGHCAFLNETPFVAVRCISDNADDEGEMSFDKFEKIAAKRVADIVLKMVEEI